ncbi:MAG: MaoC/PaaZ C-terminal domain-containing protein [Nocardioides sp.]
MVSLLKLAAPSIPGLNLLPGIRKSGGEFAGLVGTPTPVRVKRDHVDAYAEVCGFPIKDVLPLTYPHLLAFPLHSELMASPQFPAPAIGTVHLENSITQHRRIGVEESLVVSVGVDGRHPHPKGSTFGFTTRITADGELVWESISTYLRIGRGDRDAAWGLDLHDVPPSGPVFDLRADLGRRYAAVSGDYNPIHLYAATAKPLGFKRQIAHGMWTKARCVAALESRLPARVTVQVAFKKPCFLPSSVALGTLATEAGYDFSLSKPGADTVHLLGRTTA